MIHHESSGTSPGPGLPSEERERRNRSVLFSFTLVCALALLLVSGLPSALIAPALAQLLGFASFGAALVAALWREPLIATHLTHWDKALVLLGLSIAAGMFADPVQVEQALSGLAQDQGLDNRLGVGGSS